MEIQPPRGVAKIDRQTTAHSVTRVDTFAIVAGVVQ